MSHVKGKTKSEILDGTAQPGSQYHEQQKTEMIFRCSENIQVALVKQTKATHKVNNALGQLNSRIESLENTFKEFLKSSEKYSLHLIFSPAF